MIQKQPDRDTIISEDAALVAKAKEDMSHFDGLYRKYYSQIFRFVRKRVLDQNQVNDITSQVFLKAMLKLENYKHQGFPFSSWLYRIALSEMGNMFRKNSAHRMIRLDDEVTKELAEDIVNPTEKVDALELGKAMNTLSEENLNMLEMRYFEKIKLKEIAQIMNLTESNAKVKMHRTINKLRKQLNS